MVQLFVLQYSVLYFFETEGFGDCTIAEYIWWCIMLGAFLVTSVLFLGLIKAVPLQ